jgi:hypothetical protein
MIPDGYVSPHMYTGNQAGYKIIAKNEVNRQFFATF